MEWQLLFLVLGLVGRALAGVVESLPVSSNRAGLRHLAQLSSGRTSSFVKSTRYRDAFDTCVRSRAGSVKCPATADRGDDDKTVEPTSPPLPPYYYHQSHQHHYPAKITIPSILDTVLENLGSKSPSERTGGMQIPRSSIPDDPRVACAKVLFYNTHFERQFCITFINETEFMGRRRKPKGEYDRNTEGITSREIEGGMLRKLEINTTLLRDLSNIPRVESLLVHTIQSYYAFLDSFLNDPEKQALALSQHLSLGLAPALFRNAGFRSFLKAHHRQLCHSTRLAYRSKLGSQSSLGNSSSMNSTTDALFTLAYLNARALNEVIAKELESLISRTYEDGASSSSINSYVSQTTIRLVLDIVGKTMGDIKAIRTLKLASIVELTDTKGFLWDRSFAPIFAPRHISEVVVTALNQKNKASESSRRMLRLCAEFRKQTLVYSVLVALRVVYRKLLESSLPGPLVPAFSGEGLLVPDEVAIYALRNTATSAKRPPLVQAYMLQLLIDVSMGIYKDVLGTDMILEDYISQDAETFVPLPHKSAFITATWTQRCFADTLRMLLSLLEKGDVVWSERLSMPASSLIRAFIAQMRLDLRDLNGLIDLSPLSPVDDAVQLKWCGETSALIMKLFGISVR